jgi:uncharacterized protein YoaH (UPF0181 family)
MTYQHLLDTLPTFTYEQQQAIHQRVTVLLAYGTPSKSPVKNVRETELYQALSIVLEERRLPPQLWAIFCRQRVYKTFVEQVRGLEPFLDEFATLSVRERLALYRMMISMVCTHLQAKRVVVSRQTVVSHLSLIPSLFDDAFPGYLDQGWLPLLAKSFMK